MKDNLPISLVAAFVVGAVQLGALIHFWTYFPIYSPITPLGISAWIHGSFSWPTIFVIDTIINLILCLPAAWVILKLRPQRWVIYLVVAVVPGFLWQFENFWLDPSLFQQWRMFLPGAITAALTLPASFLILRHFTKHQAS